jgi:hypothetical protein
MKKKLPVQQHLKLLDKPIWTPSTKVSKMNRWNDQKGFEISSLRRLPMMHDRLVLGSLMKESQRRDNAKILTFDSIHNLTKLCEFKSTGSMLDRMGDTLHILEKVHLHYEAGIEYDVDKCVEMFGILDHVSIKPGRVVIRFNEFFLELNQDKYIRRIRLDLMKHIGYEISPLALRLYEILVIFLYHRGTFTIGVENLALKMGVEYAPKYRLRFLEKIKDATEEMIKLEDEFGDMELLYDEEKNMITFRKKER